jgi:endonuclease/exonuclease/phosphatase (EEP) superfamily protein YafD
VLIWLRPHIEAAFYFLFGTVAGCNIFLASKIFPYTPFAKKEVLQHPAKDGADVRIYTANVLQTNADFHRLLQQVKTADPDIIFLVETSQRWASAMQVLEEGYPHTIHQPLDNTYGLLFFSRLPLRNSTVLFRVDNEVPSIETEVQLRCGQWVKIFGLHPKPPVPGESLYSTAKDKELMKVAFEVKAQTAPCIVMGDLNDVAWSHVTKLFRKVSGLLDPRRGRGFYSTFSANNPIMRFPLDYLFCSSHFGLVSMRRMPHNGSDHFAMYIHLCFDPSLASQQEEPAADEKEVEEAKEKTAEPTPSQ